MRSHPFLKVKVFGIHPLHLPSPSPSPDSSDSSSCIHKFVALSSWSWPLDLPSPDDGAFDKIDGAFPCILSRDRQDWYRGSEVRSHPDQASGEGRCGCDTWRSGILVVQWWIRCSQDFLGLRYLGSNATGRVSCTYLFLFRLVALASDGCLCQIFRFSVLLNVVHTVCIPII
jgi:hypothetical protein